ncbi:DUF1302 family protein [Cupriavidus taiwanensis]|uniref:DUF1302 family protein n=1 Tax=Cupriavidus taiwanensis TaxID=164546 RepID=UPI003D171FE0
MGESVFIANIAGTQGPADATKAFVPGAGVKDILLPVPQVPVQWEVTPSYCLMGYYLFTCKPNRLSAPGNDSPHPATISVLATWWVWCGQCGTSVLLILTVAFRDNRIEFFLTLR